MEYCANKNKNKGFTIVELIVVIAIMATLTGVVAPAFIKYVTKNKADACRTNREAIAKVYEKCIYEGSLNLETGDVNGLIAESVTTVNSLYLGEVDQHKNCDNRTDRFSGTVVENGEGVYEVNIKCSEHDTDIVTLDIIGWGGKNDDGADPTLAAPSTTPTPAPTMPGGGTPEDEIDPPTPTKEPSWWPYLDDERWDGKRVPGQYVEVNTGVCFSDNGIRYAIIDDSNDGTWTGTGKYQIYYKWSSGPGYIDSTEACWYKIRELSGTEWTKSEFSYENNNYSQTITPITVGDILIIGDYVFVWNGDWNTHAKDWVPVPDYNGSGVPNNKYGEWYCVGTVAAYRGLLK